MTMRPIEVEAGYVPLVRRKSPSPPKRKSKVQLRVREEDLWMLIPFALIAMVVVMWMYIGC
jgi:hypothetical protein